MNTNMDLLTISWILSLEIYFCQRFSISRNNNNIFTSHTLGISIAVQVVASYNYELNQWLVFVIILAIKIG